MSNLIEIDQTREARFVAKLSALRGRDAVRAGVRRPHTVSEALDTLFEGTQTHVLLGLFFDLVLRGDVDSFLMSRKDLEREMNGSDRNFARFNLANNGAKPYSGMLRELNDNVIARFVKPSSSKGLMIVQIVDPWLRSQLCASTEEAKVLMRKFNEGAELCLHQEDGEVIVLGVA